MSITLVSNSGSFRPAYNPIQWVVTSTNVSRCEFLYLCDVYINGSFIVRLKAEPGLNDYGYFRIERVIQDYISKNFKYKTVGFSDNADSYCEYYLEFREQYNSNYSTTCVGSDTISSVLYTGSTFKAWNGALQYKELIDFISTNYILDSPVTKFLNFTPTKTRIKFDSWFVASFLQDSTLADSLQIKTYDASFNLLNTYNLPNSSSPIQVGAHCSVGVGVNNLNAYSESLSPSVDWIDSSVYFYTVQLLDSSTNQISEVLIFEIDNRCYKFNRYSIWWQNRKGAYNNYDFSLLAKRNINTNQITYEKILDVNYSEGDRGTTALSEYATESLIFNTDRLRKEEVHYIEDLYTSGDIYIVDANLNDKNIAITGAVYNAGTASFVLTYSGTIPIGTTFTYIVDDGSPIGMANSGGGIITGIEPISGYYTTDVPATIYAGGFINGYMIAKIIIEKIIPVIRTTSSFEDNSLPKPVNSSINYSIELQPSYKLNIQSS